MAKAFDRLLRDFDKVAGSLVLGGPTLCAQKVVKDLQEIGPRWSGQFSNSWEIKGPQGQTVRGTGQPGQPQPIEFTSAPFTGRQAFTTTYRTFLGKDKVVFTISNFSPHAGIALDLEPGIFVKPREDSLKDPIKTGKREGGIRGNITAGKGGNESTAVLDWYKVYLGGGKVNKTIQVIMDGIKVGFR